MSSLLPSGSSTTTSEIPVCYQIECDASNSQIIIKLGSSTVTCPTAGGTVSAPSGFKGSVECPKYSDLCLSDGSTCNDMYSCFTSLAQEDNYNYQLSYSDYEGSPADLGDDDDNIYPISRSFSFNIKTNFALLAAICLLIFLK